MSKPHIVQNIYGFAVCLFAVLVMALSLPSVISSLVDLTDIKSSDSYYQGDTFEEMKVRSLEKKEGPVIDEKLLKDIYDKKVQTAHKRAFQKIKRSLANNLTLFIIGVILFITHTFWLRKLKYDQASS